MSKAYQSIPAPSGDQRRIVADGRGKLLNSVGVTVAVVKDLSGTLLVVLWREKVVTYFLHFHFDEEARKKKVKKIGKSQKKTTKNQRGRTRNRNTSKPWSCRAAIVTTFSTRTLRTTLQVWTYQERDIIWLASLASWTGVSSSLQQTCQWYDIESGDQKEKLFLTFWHDWRRSWGGRTTPGELFINTVAIGVLTCG